MKSNKIIVITGATGGIGKAIAYKLDAPDRTLVLHYRQNRQAIEEMGSSLKADIIPIQADFSLEKEIDAFLDTLYKKVPYVDVLVNNAAIYQTMPFENTILEDFKKNLELTWTVNLKSMAWLSYSVAQKMKNRGCRIINISSRGAFRGEPEAFSYAAAKAGMNALGQSMAQALAPYKILVFTIAPGFIETPMSLPYLKGEKRKEIENQSPFKRVGNPEEVARIVSFCAFEAPEYMSGAIIDINGASYLRS